MNNNSKIARWGACAARVLLVALVVLSVAHTAQACPSCQSALEQDQASQGDLVGGFFWSILFMMAMPFTILGGMSGYMYLLVRRARATPADDVDEAFSTASEPTPPAADRRADDLVGVR